MNLFRFFSKDPLRSPFSALRIDELRQRLPALGARAGSADFSDSTGSATGRKPSIFALPYRWLSLITRHWRLLGSALVAGAIVHIIVTLNAANLGASSALRTLMRDLPINQVAFAEPVSAEAQPLAFYNPDALYAYCRYNAATARIRVSATLPEAGWSLSLHTPKGENFYYVPGSASQITNIELVLEPPGNVFAHGNIEITTANQAIPRVQLPNVRGLVILRAPIKGFAYRRLTDEQRSAFRCEAQTAPAK